jgi:carboxylesterase type B
MIINNGDNMYHNKPLFRAAMMDSGSIVPAVTVSDPKAQNIYDQVVATAGCSGAADTLACLRTLPYDIYLNAANSVPGIFSYSSVDLSYLPRPDPKSAFFSLSPELSVMNGKYAHVPVIIGDQSDEGTLFSLVQSNITTNDQLIAYISSYFPYASTAQVSEYVNSYPDDLGISGSPFNTSIANNLYPQFKRLAAILGDAVFTLSRRAYLELVSGDIPAWSYLSTYDYGTPILGTFHASDLLLLYFNPTTLVNPVPTNTILTYYISFINNLTPNGGVATKAGLGSWPQWTNGTRQLLNFQALASPIIKDDFRQGSFEVLKKYTSVFRV